MSSHYALQLGLSNGDAAEWARLGDGWVASAWHSTPEEFRSALGTLEQALTKQGREVDSFPNAVNTMFMYIHEDGMQARKLAVPIIERATGTSFDPDSGHYLVGSYQECLVLLERWVEAGAKQVCVWPVSDPAEQIRRFGEHILPKSSQSQDLIPPALTQSNVLAQVLALEGIQHGNHR